MNRAGIIHFITTITDMGLVRLPSKIDDVVDDAFLLRYPVIKVSQMCFLTIWQDVNNGMIFTCFTSGAARNEEVPEK